MSFCLPELLLSIPSIQLSPSLFLIPPASPSSHAFECFPLKVVVSWNALLPQSLGLLPHFIQWELKCHFLRLPTLSSWINAQLLCLSIPSLAYCYSWQWITSLCLIMFKFLFNYVFIILFPAECKPATDRDIFFFTVVSSSLGQLLEHSGVSIRGLSDSKWI